MKDASQNVIASARLLNQEQKQEVVDELNTKYAELRSQREGQQSDMLSIEEARRRKPNFF